MYKECIDKIILKIITKMYYNRYNILFVVVIPTM